MSKASEWDRSLVQRMVRTRYEFYGAIVDRLMREEARLLPLAGDELREPLIQMAHRIQVVEDNGGDASAIRASKAALEASRDEHQPALAKVQRMLAAARECLKWSDMASEGMHWLCFAEPRYARLLEEGK